MDSIPGNHAVGGPLVLDLEHDALVWLIGDGERLGDEAVQAGTLEFFEPSLCGGLIGALAAGPALAESYKFTLYNHSKYAIEGFQTYEKGHWDSWKNVSVDQGRLWSDDCLAAYATVLPSVPFSDCL